MDILSVEDVRRELPNVLVRWHGKLWTGRVTGRLNQFATVSPWVEHNRRKEMRAIIGPCFQVAWDTVTRCINTGRPVICD